MNRKERRAAQARSQVPVPPRRGHAPISLADRLFDSAVELHAAGRLAEAENTYRRVLRLDPKHADSLNSLGILVHQSGHGDAAIKLIGQAIALNNRNAQYHYNLGLVCAALGRMDDVVTHNRRAIALEPDYADAHTNLASALSAQGHVSEAVLHLRQALDRRTDSPLAYNNLATALLAEHKPEEALSVIVGGLAVKQTDALKHIFVLCIQNLQSLPKIPGLRTLVERSMVECWARPNDLATVLTTLVKQNEAISARIERAGMQAVGVPVPQPFGPQDVVAIANDRLLQCLMVSTAICDIPLEQLLTNARAVVLDLATASTATDVSGDVLDFCCALAQQCFINEYVHDIGREEQDRARALCDRLAIALISDDVVPPLMVAAVAAYFPLHSLDVPPTRFERSWPDGVTRLVVQQIREPADEQSLRASIPVLTPIADSVSALVRQQYEENPYPRWTATSSLDMRVTFDSNLRIQFPHAAFAPLGKTDIDVLIAGCGTGRHAIEAARLYGTRMLAIDLSLASLGYAKRKAGELGLTNIELGQADILQLGSLGRTFDVIEAVGVLHHLRDPLEGWRTLIALLRPGGFMRIGLYSALARQQFSAARAYIAERRYGKTADEIRQCRQDIMGFDDGTLLKETSRSSDFFTLSGCRDLMFHVQEHLTDIPAIKSFLAANHLTFVGFENPARGRYAERFPDDKAMTDLDCWHAFETEHPATFVRMYQFWVQKPVQAAVAG
jgi:tetratricopeptide (TPR) repeat protein/SAM-dependent methyltransferase